MREGRASPGPPPRQGRLIVILAIALAAGGAVVGAWLWWSKRQREAPARLVLYGNVDIREVELAFNASERIAVMLAEEGDVVTAGQLLATLELDRFREAVARAEARADAQRQIVARLEAGTRPEEIRKAQADVEAAEAEVELARRNYDHVLELSERSAANQIEVDDARTAHDVAQARFKAGRETLALAVAGPRVEEIAEAKATLRALEAELELARRDLAQASLYAPAGGVVRTRVLEPGDMASPVKPAYTIAQVDPLWVRAYVSERELGLISPGMPATVTTDSYPGKHYEAWVGFISPTAEFTPKSVETTEVRATLVYQVRVFVRNPQDELRLGMPATVIIPLDGSDSREERR